MGTKTYSVYIMASQRNGTLYTGITGDMPRRMEQHRNGEGSKFVKQYKVLRLVYAEAFDDPSEAIAHEKRLKKWRRSWKLKLIEASNPDWEDLSTLMM